MNFTDLPKTIAKGFLKVAVARIGRRDNRNGKHITVVTLTGARYRWTMKPGADKFIHS